MAQKFPRSPYDQTSGLVYFARMLEKIRLHAAGELPESHHSSLGKSFDGRCVKLLGVKYEDLCERVLGGFTDDQALQWCFQNGRRPDADEIEIWNSFMMKRGWRDEFSDRIVFRLKEAGLEHADAQAVTMFDFIDLDEGRTPPDFSRWEPPRLAKG